MKLLDHVIQKSRQRCERGKVGQHPPRLRRVVRARDSCLSPFVPAVGKGADPVALWSVSPELHLDNTVQLALMVQVLHIYRYTNT